MALKDELKKQKKEEVKEVTKTRKRPAPLTGRNVLTVEGQEPGYKYRVVNDVGSRVEQFKERGYEVVASEDVRIGDRRVATVGGVGSPATALVGSDGQKAIVMRIPEDWYMEDQAAKQKYVDELENSIKRSKSGDYGAVNIKDSK